MFIKNKTKNAKRLRIKMKDVGDFLYVKIFSVLYIKSNPTNNILMYMQKCGLVYFYDQKLADKNSHGCYQIHNFSALSCEHRHDICL